MRNLGVFSKQLLSGYLYAVLHLKRATSNASSRFCANPFPVYEQSSADKLALWSLFPPLPSVYSRLFYLHSLAQGQYRPIQRARNGLRVNIKAALAPLLENYKSAVRDKRYEDVPLVTTKTEIRLLIHQVEQEDVSLPGQPKPAPESTRCRAAPLGSTWSQPG